MVLPLFQFSAVDFFNFQLRVGLFWLVIPSVSRSQLALLAEALHGWADIVLTEYLLTCLPIFSFFFSEPFGELIFQAFLKVMLDSATAVHPTAQTQTVNERLTLH